MNKKRTKLEVVKDILEVLRENRNVKITHLIYKSNLSNNSIKRYLDELISSKLIAFEVNEDKKIYKLTDKGCNFLNDFNKIKIFSDSYGLGEFF